MRPYKSFCDQFKAETSENVFYMLCMAEEDLYLL